MNDRVHSAQAFIYFESHGAPPKVLPRKALDACGHALAAIVTDQPARWRLLVAADDPQQGFAQLLAKAQGLRVEVIGADAADWRATADARLVLYAAQRPPAPASLGSGAARWIAVHATEGERWEADAGGTWHPPTWLNETLAQAGSTLAESVESIFARNDALAHATAPDTRRAGKLLIAIEAICVLLPVIWLLRTPLQLPPMVAAAAGLASPLLIVAFCWWLRWRSMGRLGSRARLVAEACRSLLATRSAPSQPVVQALAMVPALRPLLQKFAAEPAQVVPDWRVAYLRDRIDGQHAYYLRQRDRALRERQRLTRWSTILMDLALAVGIAGLAVTLHPRSASWLSILGGSWLDFVLGMAGLALPLGLLVAQSLRLVGESTRRTARYTQQLLHLESLRERFATADDAQALELLRETEDTLLSEVLDWYFQSETTEDFYTIREQSAVAVPARLETRRKIRFELAWRWLDRLGAAAGFMVRVVLGRLIWVIVSVAFVLLWVSLKQTETPDVASRLADLGRMLDPWRGSLFEPQTVAAANGTLVIAHGMRDGWEPVATDSEIACGGPGAHWTTEIAARVRERAGASAPQMMVLDWREGARASQSHALNTKDPLTAFLADLGGVRSSGEITGDYFGIRLVRMVDNGQIRRDRPLHLIGHSAGGFVVSRAAHILVAMGFPRDLVHVTILDTPEPNREVSVDVARHASAEFYRTSDLAQVEAADLDPAIHFRHVPIPPGAPAGFGGQMFAHSYASDWYCESVVTARCGDDDGFGRSPFCR